MTDTFCIDDNMMLLSTLSVLDDAVNQCLLISVIPLWQKDVLCSVSKAAPKCNVSGISSHYFNNTAALVGSGCITNLINGFHGSVHCSIKADGIIGTCDI